MHTYYPHVSVQCGIRLKPVLAFLLLLLLSSCGEEEMMPDNPDVKSECEVTIRLNLDEFGLDGRSMTRSYVGGNENENRINNIWVFQYDAETGSSLHVPVYFDKDRFDSNDIEVNLTLNENGAESLVCIVANAGEKADDGSMWALDSNGNIKESFDTYGKLLTQALPAASSRPFISSNMGESGGMVIPMYGVSKAMAIVSRCYVSVPLVRMLARVDVNVDPAYYDEAGMKIEKIRLRNIPAYCRVGTLASGDGYENAAIYPDIHWRDFDAGEANSVTVYLPENLQGIVDGMSGKHEADGKKIPEHALCVELTMSYEEGAKTHTYNIYPGFDMESDFNVMRNHIYNVSIKINKLPE